jgi:L-fuconolactonase
MAMIDTHHHLWRRSEAKQAGILSAPYLQRDVLWDDFRAAWGGLPVEAAVNVQVNDFVDGLAEARFVQGIAAGHPRLRAMIAWAQLEAPSARKQIERLRTVPLVRGVRRTCQYEADPDFCCTGAYTRGVRQLGEAGYVCEICVRLQQVLAVPRLARACPETAIVLQHLGKPDLARPPARQWLRAIEDLGRSRNVWCKVSVVVHTASDRRLAAEDVAPFVRHVVDCFGWDRVVFGSNWPVSEAVVGYREWVTMLQQVLGDASQAELQRLFSGNALALYGI